MQTTFVLDSTLVHFLVLVLLLDLLSLVRTTRRSRPDHEPLERPPSTYLANRRHYAIHQIGLHELTRNELFVANVAGSRARGVIEARTVGNPAVENMRQNLRR